MRRHEIENWALSTIERVTTGQPVEDDNVELKVELIDKNKAARRIGGHANAARGAPILWLIGVDEESGVVGVDKEQEEIADWFAQVEAEFDGLAPSVRVLNIPVDKKTVTGLYFETDRAPFVVRNTAYGKKAGGPVQFEVPWREGVSTRSARRSDLIRLLTPLQQMPEFEVLSGRLEAQFRDEEKTDLRWSLHMELYVVTFPGNTVVIPFHKCETVFEIPDSIEPTTFEDVSLKPPRYPAVGYRRITPDTVLSRPVSLSLTIDATASEVLIEGPGKVFLEAHLAGPGVQTDFDGDAHITATLLPISFEQPIRIEATFPAAGSDREDLFRWSL